MTINTSKVTFTPTQNTQNTLSGRSFETDGRRYPKIHTIFVNKRIKMVCETTNKNNERRLKKETVAVFQRAKQFLKPGELFRFTS
jgi:hypothetical protein